MKKETREPAVSGKFYPSDENELSNIIENNLDKAEPHKIKNLKAIIVPHAGYVFSGQVAAFAYKLLKKNKFSKVIMLGPSHFFSFNGSATSSYKNWKTPLGKVELIRQKTFPELEKAHSSEHSLEVQLPFLQKTLDKFTILPVVYGFQSHKELCSAVDKLLDEETLLLVSSDLSHYLPYEKANKIDKLTCKNILELDIESLKDEQNIACGLIGIMALMQLAKEKGWKPTLLRYANSGDTYGDKSGVVGYASFAFEG